MFRLPPSTGFHAARIGVIGMSFVWITGCRSLAGPPDVGLPGMANSHRRIAEAVENPVVQAAAEEPTLTEKSKKAGNQVMSFLSGREQEDLDRGKGALPGRRRSSLNWRPINPTKSEKRHLPKPPSYLVAPVRPRREPHCSKMRCSCRVKACSLPIAWSMRPMSTKSYKRNFPATAISTTLQRDCSRSAVTGSKSPKPTKTNG